MSVPWNKTAYEYADELETIIKQKNIRIKELEEECIDRLKTIHRQECEISDLGWRLQNDV